MQSIQKLLACSTLIVSALTPGVVAAQTVLGSDCGSLQVQDTQQAITLTQAVAVDQWIIVSAAANSRLAEFAPSAVSDSAGNTYPIYDVTVMASGTGLLATFAGHVVTALNAGDQITLTYQANGSSATQSCVTAAEFSGVLAIADPSDAYGENSGSGTTQSVATNTPTNYGNDLVYSVFASAATPGVMLATAPAQALDQVCSADVTLCLLPEWNIGAPVKDTTEAAAASSDNAVAWGALIIAFRNGDDIFADGFEGSP